MNKQELKQLLERLKKYKDFGATIITPAEIDLITPIIESHLQNNREYTHEEKVAMVRNREASVYHNDREAIERAMKVCFPDDNYSCNSYSTVHLNDYYFAYHKNITYWNHSKTNSLPKSFLASKFFNTSND